MASLELRCIQSIRDELLKCDARRVIQIWDESKTLKGCNEHIEFASNLRRDVVAYMVIRVVLDVFPGRVFGGFVQSHHTGLQWSDLDLCIPKFSSSHHQTIAHDAVLDAVVKFLRFTLGLSAFSTTVVKCTTSRYASRYEVKLEDVVVPIDIVSGTFLDKKKLYLPCTLGSCLEMQPNRAVTLRGVGWFPGVNSCDVVDMLRQQCDMQICDASNISESKYMIYFWKRIDKMCARGLTMHEKWFGGDPPDRHGG
jgi:hypothetical protein